MTFLQPAAFAFVALAPVIVVLYLLKLRRQPAQVSTLMFWQRVTADNRRRALFHRLRQLLSLLLHLLIFTLLLLALARPEFRAFHAGGNATVVTIDCRARMQAGGRFEAARKIAESYVRRASANEPVALIAAESAPRVAAGFTDSEKPLLDALGKLNATDAGGRIEDSLRAAGDLLPSGGKIVLITDHAPLVTPDPRAEVHLVGGSAPRENIGITRLTARPLPNSPETDEVLVELENFGPSRQSGAVELSYDGATVDVKPFDLAPGERREDVYPTLAANSGLANARGWLSAHVSLAHPDAYLTDDDAFAVIPPPRPLRVLLVTRGNLYLESLLKADAAVHYDLLTPDAFSPAAAFDAVIFDDFLPSGFDQPDHLPSGRFLFLRRTPFDKAGAVPSDRPVMTDQDRANPLLRLVDLSDTLFFRATVLSLPEATADWQFAAPVRTLDQPLIVTGERPGQRLAAFAFGVTDSELPLRVAFPLLMHNTLAWLSGRDDAASGGGLRAGEPMPLGNGESVWSKPQRTFGPVAIPPAEWIHGPGIWQPMRNGFYLRRAADGQKRWEAVNTSDREMSAINAPASADSPASGAPSRSMRLPVWPPWIYLTLAAFALCLTEWWTFHRRRTE